MAEISSEADRTAKALNDLRDAVGKFGAFVIDARKEREKEEMALRERAKRYGRRVDDINENSRSLAQTFSRLTHGGTEAARVLYDMTRKLIPGAAAILGLASAGTTLVRTYQEMSEVGQTFGGSMLRMAQAAGDAGLPLEDFAKMIQRSSAAAAALARNGGQGGSLGQLQLQVRKNIEQFGLYGMTLDQIAELTGEYAETLRLAGIIEGGNNNQRARAIANFAEDISAFSAATGKARSEIAKITQEAMRDVTATARMRQTGEGQRRALERATAFLAAMPGDIGGRLAQIMTQTFGQGTSLFVNEARTFVEAGFGEAITMFDDLNRQIMNGQVSDQSMVDFARRFVDRVSEVESGLIVQAQAGNESARQVLQMADQMRAVATMSERDIRRLRDDVRQREQLTRFATAFSSIFRRITGAFGEGFFRKLGDAASGLADRMNNGEFDNVLTSIRTFGENLGTMLGGLFTPANVSAFADGLRTLTGSFAQAMAEVTRRGGIAKVIGDFLVGVQSVMSTVMNAGKTLASVFGILTEAVRIITWPFVKLHELLASLTGNKEVAAGIAGLAAFLAFFRGGAIIRYMTDLFRGNRLGQMTVQAAQVFVNGRPVGGVGGDLGGGGNRRGRLGRFMRGAGTFGIGAAAAIGGSALIGDGESTWENIITGGLGGIVGGGLGSMIATGLGRLIGGGIGTFFGGPLGTAAGALLGGMLGDWLFGWAGRAIGSLWNRLFGSEEPPQQVQQEQQARPNPAPVPNHLGLVGGGMGVMPVPGDIQPRTLPQGAATQPARTAPVQTPPTQAPAQPQPDPAIAAQIIRLERRYEELARQHEQTQAELRQAREQARQAGNTEMLDILRRIEDTGARTVALLANMARSMERLAAAPGQGNAR